MRDEDAADARDDDAGRGREKCDGDGQRGQRFGFAVSVRVILVRRALRDAESAHDDDGRRDIGSGLDGIRNEGRAVSQDPCERLSTC